MGDRFPEKALSITEIKKVTSANPEQEPESSFFECSSKMI
jgi:hypothetical protein